MNITDHYSSFLFGVLAGDPGQTPLQICQHVLHRLGPVLLAVELDLDRVCVAGGGVTDLATVHLVRKTEPAVSSLYFFLELLKTIKKCNHS